MAFSIGTQLGPYEVSGYVGAGGMGEVYRARDPRLNRDVAIKVLPPSFSADPQRLRRFEQEARAAAGLNHSNILSVYDFGAFDGAPYIVTELLDGETLRTRLRNGRIPVRKAIEYALQIARGLAAAHDKNIVHRDLKPDNIFITRDGTVKILDFGLAKLIEAPRAELDATKTLDSDAGMVVGTVGYMSPEQVRGKPADPRSDIFAFGAVLYEMLTGNRAFAGDSTADTLSAILTKDPPDLLNPDGVIPFSLDRIVRHCLEKSPEERFQSARDIAFNLESLSSISTTSFAAVAPFAEKRIISSRRIAIALAAIALFATGLFLGRALVRKPAHPSYKQLTFRRGTVRSARLAPGGQVIYAAAWEGNPSEIFIGNVNTPGASPTGIHAEDIESISKSGEMLLISNRHFSSAFFRPGTLSRASLSGSAPRPILEDVQDADWTPDASQIAVTRAVNNRTQLEFPIGKVLYQTDGWITGPHISGDAQSVAFLDHPVFGDDGGRVAIVDLAGKVRTLTPNYASIQSLAWRSPTELWFSASTSGSSADLYSVDLSGRVHTLVQAPGGHRLLDVGSDGRAIIAQGHTRLSSIVLGNAQAKERDISIADWTLLLDLSSDGRTALLEEEAEGTPGGAYSVYLRKTDGSPPVRLGQGSALRISPDGQWVLSVTLSSKPQLQLLPVGAGEPRLIPNKDVQPANSQFACWLPDSKHFAFVGLQPDGQRHVYIQDIDGGTPRPVAAGTIGGDVRCSPDGKYLSIGDRKRISILPLDGTAPREVRGTQPNEFVISWSADGRSLFITTPLHRPAQLFRVDIETGKRELVKEFAPQDLAGIEGIGPLAVTPDLRYYGYTYGRQLTDMYTVDGLK